MTTPYRNPLPLVLCLALVLAITCCKDPEGDDDTSGYGDGDGAVHAAFEATPTSLYPLDSVHFDAGTSTDPFGVDAYYSDCAIAEFHWDFGDGQIEVSELYQLDHTYEDVGEYEVMLTVVTDGGSEDTIAGSIEVLYPIPIVVQVDVSVDGAAIIGEWIRILGEEFRTENLPEVIFGGGPSALQVRFMDSTEIHVRVPPTSPSGLQPIVIDFPQDDGGDTSVDIWVKRYAVSTDAFHDTVNFISFGDGVEYQLELQDLTIEDATLVKITGDGATAVVGDGRWDINLTPTLTFIDLTADFSPVVTNTTTDIGIGPLFDIATAVDIALVADAAGLNVVDLTDPYHPINVGRTNYPLADLAATDVELTPDGALAVVLGTFDDSIRFYDVDFNGATLISHVVDGASGIQDVQISDDGQFAYVLSGGGEGAIPPDLNLGNTCVTVVDLAIDPPGNFLGDGTCVEITSHAPIPFDIAMAPDGTAYITSFDENFAIVSSAFNGIIANPLDINAWADLLDALTSLSFGGVVLVDNIWAGQAVIGESWFLPYGFQTGIDVRYDEALYVSTGIYLEFVYDLEDILDPYAAITMTNGVAVANLDTGEVDEVTLQSDALLYYESFQIAYDYQPLLGLIMPPYSFGDVAIQP